MSKYTVIKNEDVNTFCNDEQQQGLLDAIGEVRRGRRQSGKQDAPTFVLVMTDRFAVAALEHYIRMLSEDPFKNSAAGDALLQAAMQVRDAGLMQHEQRDPD